MESAIPNQRYRSVDFARAKVIQDRLGIEAVVIGGAHSSMNAFFVLPSHGQAGLPLDLTDEETAALLRELDSLIDGDRYFMSPRIKTLKAIRAKIRPEPVRDPLPPPPKQYAPPRATTKQRRGARR